MPSAIRIKVVTPIRKALTAAIVTDTGCEPISHAPRHLLLAAER